MSEKYTQESSISIDSIHLGQHVAHGYSLIWFDPDLNEASEDYRSTLEHLQSVVDTISIFTHRDEFADFLTDLKGCRVFLVVSDTTAQQIISLLHDVPQLDQIYILCQKSPSTGEWINEWTKIKSIHPDAASLRAALALAIQQCHQDAISTSVVSPDEMNDSGNLNELEPSFMYSQIFKDILLQMQYDERSFPEFVTYCRAHDIGSSTNIELFEKDYRKKSVVWWYTWPAFIYSTLNYALRTLQTDTIIKMGFFIRELHREIQRLHEEQRCSYGGQPFYVYRGQGLSTEAFQKLVKAKGGLMSFNSFLSTSKRQDVSRLFAISASTAADTVGVHFHMTIDPAVSSIPFACIEQLSFSRTEAEILFSMHAVFRIGDIKRIDDDGELYDVELVLTADDDEALRRLTNWFADDVQDSVGWKRLGSLLLKIGQLEKAEEFYKAVLEQTTDDRDKTHYYTQLIFIKHEQGDFRMHGWYLLKAAELEKKISASNCSDSTVSDNEIGVIRLNNDEKHKGLLMYNTAIPIDREKIPSITASVIESSEDMEASSESLGFLEKALETFEKSLSTNHAHWTTSPGHIDEVNDDLKQSSPILWFQRKQLEIRQKFLPPNHPDIARSYATIASLYSNRKEHLQARSYYEKSIEIHQQILPPNHPVLACLYHNIAMTFTKTDEHSTALWFLEQSLGIAERVLPPNHPDLYATYCNIATTYEKMNDSRKALFYYKKQLSIIEESPHPDKTRVVSCCVLIGEAYRNMQQYSEALPFFEKALDVRQQILPSNDFDLANGYEIIGSLYNKTGDYVNALAYYNKLADIIENLLPSDDRRLAWCYNQIARIHKDNANYDLAIMFYGEALETIRKLSSTRCNDLAVCYSNIAVVYVQMQDYSKALLQFEQALSVINDRVPADDPGLLTIQSNIDYLKDVCSHSSGNGNVL